MNNKSGWLLLSGTPLTEMEEERVVRATRLTHPQKKVEDSGIFAGEACPTPQVEAKRKISEDLPFGIKNNKGKGDNGGELFSNPLGKITCYIISSP